MRCFAITLCALMKRGGAGSTSPIVGAWSSAFPSGLNDDAFADSETEGDPS
jgi:hypothetical protein